jgi:hypothetical protein
MRIVLTNEEVDQAYKLANQRINIRKYKLENKMAQIESAAQLHVVSVLAQLAVAKAFNLNYSQTKDPKNKRYYRADFTRDETVVPLMVKSMRRTASINSEIFFAPKSRFPFRNGKVDRIFLIACRTPSDYIVDLIGWAYTDEMIPDLKPLDSKLGKRWGFPINKLRSIHDLAPKLETLIQKARELKTPFYPSYGQFVIPHNSIRAKVVAYKQPPKYNQY